MTAVIGMLNKKGVAVAADSAVTRSRGSNEKVTKNGNKMVRVSDVVPISVMITGNASLMTIPWDVIVRKYRKDRGHIPHPTVEESVRDLLHHITVNDFFWDKDLDEEWIDENIGRFMTSLRWHSGIEAQETNEEGRIKRPRLFVKKILKCLKWDQKFYSSLGDTEDKYDFNKFASLIAPKVKYKLKVMEDYPDEDNPLESEFAIALKENFEEIREDLIKAFYYYFTYTEGDEIATLVFTGYGKDEIYPSLVAIDVFEGFDRHINWRISKKVNISDETPAAICPFAQTDVIEALLTGASESWLERIDDKMDYLYHPGILLGENAAQEGPEVKLWYYDVFDFDPSARRQKSIDKLQKENFKSWEKDLEGYDIKSMAELALTLVDLTGLQRILTFQQEGVGGDVDLAVITKNDGFTWLSRKSWYHHKDINGSYGSMGI